MVIAAAISVVPTAAAADSTFLEAEKMPVSPFYAGNRVSDSTASGKSALWMYLGASASATISVPESSGLVIRAEGHPCKGAPVLNLAIDGIKIASNIISATSWANYPVATPIAAGTHKIKLSFANPYWMLCFRSVGLDSITIVPTASPTPGGDSTAALQAEFDALTPGQSLTLSPGTYLHSGVIKIRVANVHIDGNGATLQATNDGTSAVQITAGGVSLKNLNLTAPLTGDRYYAPDQHKLVIAADNVTVTDVAINGSAGAGIFVYGASNFNLTRVSVQHSRADGVHMTNGSNNGQVNDATTTATGDDGIAVVSYGADAQPCRNIIVTNPVVNGTTWGRGISVVGGENISYRNITVSQSNAAGVYIATEGAPYYTRSVNTVDVTGGTVIGANTNPRVVHGALLVSSAAGGKSVKNVTISGLTVADTPANAQRNAGIVVTAGSVSGIAYTDIALINTTLPPLVKAGVSAGSYTTSGWTLNGAPITVR
jgi:hypothetical protein